MVLEFSGNRFGSCDSLTRDINYSLSLSEGPQSDYNGIKLSYLFSDSNPLKESRLKLILHLPTAWRLIQREPNFFKTFKTNFYIYRWKIGIAQMKCNEISDFAKSLFPNVSEKSFEGKEKGGI